MNIENRSDKKILEFDKEVDTGRLMNELYEAVPELKPVVHEDGSFDVNLRVFTNGSKLILWVPEGLSEEPINAVVEAHQLALLKEEGEL